MMQAIPTYVFGILYRRWPSLVRILSHCLAINFATLL